MLDHQDAAHADFNLAHRRGRRHVRAGRAAAVAAVALVLGPAAIRAQPGAVTPTAAYAAPVVLARFDRQTPHAMVLDRAHLYWTDRSGGGLWRISVDGGTPEPVAAELDQPRDLVVDGDDIFVATEGGVVRVDRKSGVATPFFAGDTGDILALDRGALYVAAFDGSITRVERKDGHATPLATLHGVGWIQVVDDALYATADDGDASASGKSGGVWRIPTHAKAGKPRRLATVTPAPMRLAVDDRMVYTGTMTGGDLIAVPRAGGAAKPILSAVGAVDFVLADAGGVWWSSVADGRISAASTTARAQHALFTGLGRPIDLAIDHTSLYWIGATVGGGETVIMRALRPSLAWLDGK
jgi:sugar lactone lactonase YvrE